MFNNASNKCFKITYPILSHNSFSSINHVNTCIDNVNNFLPNHCILAKGDSAATGNFFRSCDAGVLKNITVDSNTSVTLPDDDVIQSSHTAHLPNVSLPPTATKTSIFPQLASSSLVSLPQLCDNGCECLLTKDSLHVIEGGNFILDPNQQGRQVLYGKRNPLDRLWDIPIPQNTPPFIKQKANNLTNRP